MTLPRSLLALALVLAACSACGDDGGTVDAGPPDPCAPNMTYTGELLDWDSGGTIGFMGVFDATFALRSDPGMNDITAPNGRFEMCITPADGLMDVTTMAGSTYVSGVAVVQRAALVALPVQSFRSFTTTRAADFNYSASLAHVYVHIVGGSRTVTTSATPAEMHTFNAGWSTGNTGTDIYLGNIPVSTETTLTFTGGDVIAPAKVPLTAGQFTYVTAIAR